MSVSLSVSVVLLYDKGYCYCIDDADELFCQSKKIGTTVLLLQEGYSYSFCEVDRTMGRTTKRSMI